MTRVGLSRSFRTPFHYLRVLVLVLSVTFAGYHVLEEDVFGRPTWDTFFTWDTFLEISLVSLVFPVVVWLITGVAERAARQVAQEREALRQALEDVAARSAENAALLATVQTDEQRLNTLIESVQGILYELDADTLVPVFVSGASEQVLGFSNWRLVGPQGLWTHIHPDDRERVVAFCRAESDAGRGHVMEFRMVTAEGKTIWVVDRVTVGINPEQPGRIVGVLVDITDRVEAEAAAERRMADLETVQGAASILSTAEPTLSRLAKLAEYLRVSAHMDEIIIRDVDRPGGESGKVLAHAYTDRVEEAGDVPTHARIPYRDAITERKPIVANDLLKSPYAESLPAKRGVRSVMVIPLFVEGETIAVLTFGSAEPGQFTPELMTWLELIASNISQYIHNVQLQDYLRANLEVRARQLEALNKAEEATRKRAAELEYLHRAIGILNASAPGANRFAQLADFLRVLASVDSVTIRRAEPDTGAMGAMLANSHSSMIAEPSPLVAPLDRVPLTDALEQRRTIVLNDLGAGPYAQSQTARRGVRSTLNMPLIVEDKTIGSLSFGSAQAGAFTPELVSLIELIGSNLAPYVRNAQLQDELRANLGQQTRQLEALEASVESLSLLDVSDSLKAICESVRTILGVQYSVLGIWDEDDNAIALHTAGLADDERMKRGPLGIQDGGLLGGLLHESRSFRVQNVQDIPGFKGVPPGYPDVTSVMGVPVETQGPVRAALLVANRISGDAFTENDEMVMRVFANYARVYLQNERLFAQVQEERSTLASILANMTDGLVVVGDDRRILTINDASLHMLGLTQEQVIGRNGREIVRLVSPRVAEPYHGEAALAVLYRDLIEKARSGGASAEMEVMEPERRVLAVTAFPVIVSHEKTFTGILLHDLTAEREALKRKDEFISIASHELRTPLTVQLGFVELLLIRKVNEETRRQWLTHVHKESQRLASIVDDLLNVSRIDAGRVSLELKAVDLGAVIAEEAARARMLSTIHTIEVESGPGIPPVLADEDKVRQVLVNLFSNAIKYSPKGGPVTVAVRHDDASGEVVVSVTDQGLGIAQEDVKSLFISFRRLNRPETAGIRGTGLGLYIVSSLMQMMHGRVWVESQLGQGSTFFLAFQAVNPPEFTASELD